MNQPLTSSSHWQIKIIALWTTFLLALLFHTQLALMPLFHGLGVATSHTHDYASLDNIFWLMWIFFLIPLCAILAIAFYPNPKLIKSHLWLTLIYSALNLAHFLADVFVAAPSYQLSLMLFLVVVGLMLNITTYRWNQSRSHYFSSRTSGQVP